MVFLACDEDDVKEKPHMANDKRTAVKRGGSKKKAIDARVRRTRDALGDALISLMQTQPFDSITVQNVLDRARISRSTFYKHFSDKDDLFMSDVDELFQFFATTLSRSGERSDRVFPVKEFFTHVREMRVLVKSLIASGKLSGNLQLAQLHFARGIEQRLSESPRDKGTSIEQKAAIAFFGSRIDNLDAERGQVREDCAANNGQRQNSAKCRSSRNQQ